MLLFLWLFFLVWFVWALCVNIKRAFHWCTRLFGWETDPEEIETLQAIRAVDKACDKLVMERELKARDGFVITKEELDWWDKLGYRPRI